MATLAASAASLARCSDSLARSASRLCRVDCAAVSRKSRVARSIVTPNSTASTASGVDWARSANRLTTISEPSCMAVSQRKDCPAIDMKKAAVATEPQMMTT